MRTPLNDDQRKLYYLAIDAQRTHNFCVGLRLLQIRYAAAGVFAFVVGVVVGRMI